MSGSRRSVRYNVVSKMISFSMEYMKTTSRCFCKSKDVEEEHEANTAKAIAITCSRKCHLPAKLQV